MNNPILETTIIGSYPIHHSRTELMRQYNRGMEEEEHLIQVLQEAVQEQLRAGMDTLSDGQTRDGMIEAFVRRLGGTRLHGRAVIMGEIRHRGPITLDDLKAARSVMPKENRLKAVLTGPFTLASACTDEYYRNIREAAFAFAIALKEEALAVQPFVDVIQVDEPFFTDNYPEYGRELVETITGGLEKETALHVCGDVSKIFPHLVEFKVDLLEHEFAANPHLLDVVREYDFPQRLGYGSVRSDSEKVEGVEWIMEHVRKALAHFPPERLVLCTDCGLRHQPREAAFQKLKNMVEARNILLEEKTWLER
ncbi:MAG: hypothetical protein QCI38_00055 [Candidatus Thermoplasmatota archaeon]|nr:hypothetical protein [Candidatus Thermoplasmatota archaeon]